MHEDVLPPIPLSSPLPPLSAPSSPPSTTPPSLVPLVQGAAQQQHWLATIARMRAQPGADLRELADIEAHITQGVSLPLITSPSIDSYTNTPSVAQHADAVRKRLREYMQFGALVRLPAHNSLHDSSLRIQPLHVIIKDGKKPRLVIDLSRNLNDHLRYDYFRYSCVDDAVEASSPGCWYGKLDLSNCFLSFPLHPSVRKYFCFRFEGELYQFTSMPFGLSTAPRVCTQLLSVIQFALAEQGIHDIRYLDDFFLIAQSEKDMTRDLLSAQSVIRQFGLVVNPDKTEGPAQRLSFLGVQLDSIAQTVSCTPERVEELTTLLRSLLRQRVITRRHTASLIGKLSFAAQVLPGARPFMRRMLDTLHQWHVQTTLSTRPHRPRLPGRCALLGPAASSLERQTAMARLSSQPIRLRHGRQPQRLRLLPRVHTYAAWQYGRLCGVAPTPPGRGNIQRQLLPRTRSTPPLAHSDRMVRALGGGCLRIHLRPVAGRSVHALLRRQHVRRPHHQPTGDSQQGTRRPAPPAVPHRLRAQHRHPRRAPPGSRQHAGRLPQPTRPAPSRPRRAVGRRSPVRLCSSVRCVPGV